MIQDNPNTDAIITAYANHETVIRYLTLFYFNFRTWKMRLLLELTGPFDEHIENII